MLDKDLNNLDNESLLELLSMLEGMDNVLEDELNTVNRGSDSNENEL
jgi:hypothetical protein